MSDAYYARSADVASRVVGGEAVLVMMPEGILYVLSPSASRIWVRADGTRPGAELTEGLDAAAAGAFLSHMSELGLLVRSSAPLAEPLAFPQDVEVPPSPEAPAIRATEPVETLAGSSCDGQTQPPCDVIVLEL